MLNLSEQFILILNKLEISGYRAAKDLGVTQTTIANIKKGTAPSSKIISIMIELYGVNPIWLFLNKGKMLMTDHLLSLGIDPDDTEDLPVSEISLKIDPNEKIVALMQEPESEYVGTKKSLLMVEVYIKDNQILEAKPVNVKTLENLKAEIDKNTAALKSLTKIVTRNLK